MHASALYDLITTPRYMPYVMTAGPLDVAAWKQQLLVLGQSTSSAQIRLILYTMSARRLFETAMVSRAHYSVVAEFLAFLACNGIEEDAMSADGSETTSDACRDDLHILAPRVRWPSPGLVDLAGLDDLPPELALQIVRALTFADRGRLALASERSSDLVAYDLKVLAETILHHFQLRHDEVRLMQAATGTVIGGSTITTLVAPHRSFTPGDLDCIVPCYKGHAVVDFLRIGSGYEVIATGLGFHGVPHVNRVWTMEKGSLTINVVECLTENVLDIILCFHMSCVYGFWNADCVWHGYAGLTADGTAVTTPTKFPYPSEQNTVTDIWNVTHKYIDRGLTIAVNELPWKHTCGVDKDCPATIRTTDDDGCSSVSFPPWAYSGDARPIIPTTWTFRGTGCAQGALLRAGSPYWPAGAPHDRAWEGLFRSQIAHGSPPLSSSP
ncbi:hypothetical protein C8R47DRAFT_1231255 [Mycena vitilis]|nr:hypothetical protein C8R47DRAFT_1231255 [Mycena vitilis]